MSGAVRAGLIFGGISLVAVPLLAALNFVIPLGCLCGSLAAALLGGLAGFYAIRWDAKPTLGRATLAASLTGLGTLIGGLIFFVGFFALLLSEPFGQELLRQQLEVAMQRQGQPMPPEQAAELTNLIRGVIGPIAGVCFGMVNLLVALGCGLLGALVAQRGRNGPPPAASDPFGPPPLAPQ